MENINLETAKKLGLLEEEFEKIKEILGRTPNYTELSIFSVMWSEHASYKNSIKWLKTLPRSGKQIVVEAGEENAGMVDLGDNLACVFKIESHNHPSAIEPYQGAATGVGGIGDYGNAFGVPVVGGEMVFDDCYNTNPLVNAMSVGLIKKGDEISAISEGVGNPVYIVGSSTGKDGIHGATFASADITENSEDDIPAIQIGDPFQEKLLLEASLELGKKEILIGMQDMGAAGIICSTSEMSAKGKHGMRIDLSKVPLRQKNMKAFEILLSESQERMLIVLQKGKEEVLKNIFKKWDLNCKKIGEVIEGDRLEFFHNGEKVADVPASDLVLGGGAPVYEREYEEPDYYKENKKFKIESLPIPQDLRDTAWDMLRNPNICSKKWVIEQYDSMVQTNNMSTNFPSDAGVVNIKKTNKALVLTTDCNSRYVYADPNIGTQIAVAEASRNIVCSGGEPLAITNCLNFGNPYKKDVFWQFVNTIKGMSIACKKFNTPVTGGNVSFYNQITMDGKTSSVYPTPVIGMLGILKDKNKQMTIPFKNKGDMIYLLGETKNDISSSEYLISNFKIRNSGAPYFDLEEEFNLQEVLKSLIKNNLIRSAHDISMGGLFTSMVECAIPNLLGFDITSPASIRKDAFLFGESQSRVIITVTPRNEIRFVDFMIKKNIPYSVMGHVTKGEMRIDDISYGFVEKAKKVYEETLEKLIV
ncbi:MAG: phosphoribosylformylglycinamidine synthase II [Bacteroidetes bacterium 4572_128]|nr:MAG: phosphoribosylformylglycinamidine synthase II [Bacteroidetes bacterium 4572_128]